MDDSFISMGLLNWQCSTVHNNVRASLVGLLAFGVLVGLKNSVERIAQLSAFSIPSLQPLKKNAKLHSVKCSKHNIIYRANLYKDNLNAIFTTNLERLLNPMHLSLHAQSLKLPEKLILQFYLKY